MVTGRMNLYSNEFKITATKFVGYPVMLTQGVAAATSSLYAVTHSHREEARRKERK